MDVVVKESVEFVFVKNIRLNIKINRRKCFVPNSRLDQKNRSFLIFRPFFDQKLKKESILLAEAGVWYKKK